MFAFCIFAFESLLQFLLCFVFVLLLFAFPIISAFLLVFMLSDENYLTVALVPFFRIARIVTQIEFLFI